MLTPCIPIAMSGQLDCTMIRSFCRVGRYLALLRDPGKRHITSIIESEMPSVRTTAYAWSGSNDQNPCPSYDSKTASFPHSLDRTTMQHLETFLNARYETPTHRYKARYVPHTHQSDQGITLLTTKIRRRRTTPALGHSLSTAAITPNNSFIEIRCHGLTRTRYAQIVDIFEHRRPALEGNAYIDQVFLYIKVLRTPKTLPQTCADLGSLQPRFFMDFSKVSKGTSVDVVDDMVIDTSCVVSHAAAFRYTAKLLHTQMPLLGLISISHYDFGNA